MLIAESEQFALNSFSSRSGGQNNQVVSGAIMQNRLDCSEKVEVPSSAIFNVLIKTMSV